MTELTMTKPDQLIDKKNVEQIEQKVRELLPDDNVSFRPFAYYDERLDCIRVLVRDCSCTESRIDEVFTVLENNYPMTNENKYVGFTIKGIRHILNTIGVTPDGYIQLTKLLDHIVQTYPQSTVDLVVTTVARPLIERAQIDEVRIAA